MRDRLESIEILYWLRATLSSNIKIYINDDKSGKDILTLYLLRHSFFNNKTYKVLVSSHVINYEAKPEVKWKRA